MKRSRIIMMALAIAMFFTMLPLRANAADTNVTAINGGETIYGTVAYGSPVHYAIAVPGSGEMIINLKTDGTLYVAVKNNNGEEIAPSKYSKKAGTSSMVMKDSLYGGYYLIKWGMGSHGEGTFVYNLQQGDYTITLSTSYVAGLSSIEMVVTTPVGFADVPAGEWYADPVAWAVEKEITNGTGDGKFSPDQNCTEAQILTFLYRAARGEGAASADDMDKAVTWAREKGMIDNTFDGNTFCTRATAVNYIWQAFGKLTAKASSFTDVPTNAAYAKAVDWAVDKGITKGDGSEDTFAPDKVCTRGHIVTFLYRAYNN